MYFWIAENKQIVACDYLHNILVATCHPHLMTLLSGSENSTETIYFIRDRH